MNLDRSLGSAKV